MTDENVEKSPVKTVSSVFAQDIPSKLGMTLVLAYLCNFEDITSLLMRLSTKSQNFLHINYQ